MKKLYVDRKELGGCTGIFLRDTQVIAAGAEINAAPVKMKGPATRRLGEELGIYVIFADALPELPIYTVPHTYIVATVKDGGYIAVLEDSPAYYLHPAGKCYEIAQGIRALLQLEPDWRERMTQTENIRIFPSKEAAKQELEFLDVSQIKNS